MHNQLFRKTHRFLCDVLKFPKSISSSSRFNSTIETFNSDPKVKTAEDRSGEESFTEEEEEEEEESAVLNKECFSEMVPKDDNNSHPWPEWVNLMEHLTKKGYYYHERNESQSEMSHNDSNLIRTACLNFGRDRFDVIRYLSKKDIRVVVRCGCPSLDRKVVNSGKRLRAHLGIDERNVCSSCCLRGSCERAYINARRDEKSGRTVDVMRILMTYGLHPVIGSVENKLALNKRLKNSVRKLLTETVEFSNEELDSASPEKTSLKRAPCLEHSIQPLKGQITVPMKKGDWICPTCNFMNFAKNVKCLRCEGFSQQRQERFAEDQDHLPLKRGDWLCCTCNFLNFAKNTRCFQCKERPSNRHLGPGEWECESCNYVNFRKNMVCINCDWKRPKASNYWDTVAERHREGFHQPYSMNFGRHDGKSDNRFSGRQERQSQKTGTEFWSSEENSEEENCLSSFNSELADFSILGGKTDISQDPQARVKWEEDMSRVRRIVSAERENNTELPKKLGSPQSAKDDEMDDWFGNGK